MVIPWTMYFSQDIGGSSNVAVIATATVAGIAMVGIATLTLALCVRGKKIKGNARDL